MWNGALHQVLIGNCKQKQLRISYPTIPTRIAEFHKTLQPNAREDVHNRLSCIAHEETKWSSYRDRQFCRFHETKHKFTILSNICSHCYVLQGVTTTMDNVLIYLPKSTECTTRIKPNKNYELSIILVSQRNWL